MDNPTLDGMKDLLPFLNFLKDKKIWFTLEHWRPEAITVVINMVTMRLEVDFFDDHIEYSYFTGDESVLDDQQKLFDLIRELGT